MATDGTSSSAFPERKSSSASRAEVNIRAGNDERLLRQQHAARAQVVGYAVVVMSPAPTSFSRARRASSSRRTGGPQASGAEPNPHDLLRAQETLNVLTNAELVIQSCPARKASSKQLMFTRLDYPEMDPPEWHNFITVWRDESGVRTGALPIDYYGNLTDNYERLNADYAKGAPR